MGVADYHCCLFNSEGEQDLVTDFDVISDDVSPDTKMKVIFRESECGQEILENNEDEEINKIDANEILDTYLEAIYTGGERSAYLEIWVKGKSIPTYHLVEYSWDTRLFNDGTGNFGWGIELGDLGHTWSPTKDNFNVDYPPSYLIEDLLGKVTIRAWSPTAYKILTAKKWTPEISDLALAVAARKLNLLWRSRTRQELLDEIQEKLKKLFSNPYKTEGNTYICENKQIT